MIVIASCHASTRIGYTSLLISVMVRYHEFPEVVSNLLFLLGCGAVLVLSRDITPASNPGRSGHLWRYPWHLYDGVGHPITNLLRTTRA